MSENGTGSLAAALVAAQSEMPKVEADGVNPHFHSKFVTLDNLIARTRPVLNRHGLAITQAPTHIDGVPALATTIYHSSGESATDTMPLILSGSDMQKLGAALTYARRYAWAALLGISEQEDDDGNAASTGPAEVLATKAQKDHIHRLIAKMEKEFGVTESELRAGMQRVYGTQITTKLTKEQAAEFITRLKKAAGEEES
jgi:hypothetical protein